MNSFRFVDALG
jgi:D-amino-acid dehydrogenase